MKLWGLAVLVASSTAHAFCGFFVAGSDAKLYNNASQVVLLRKGNHTVMSLSNNYKGPAEDFAMVVPVPVVLHKEDVKTLAADVFDKVDQLSAPRLVEYWEEDPCHPRMMSKGKGAMRRGNDDLDDLAGGGSGGVKVVARFSVGEYDVVVLSAADSGGLDRWLRANKYNIPVGAAEALAPYVRDQMKFFVAKVDIKKVKHDAHGLVQLSPLRFGFDAQELRLPVRLGLLNANGKQDLIVYILHPSSRFEVANYKNVFIPTNLEVTDAVRRSYGSFYATLFDQTLAKHDDKAIVTEYAWQTDSCDPCPVPPLQPSDIATLGGDDQPTGAQNDYTFSSWVLTRLHARYSKTSLSEDLVFREAPPVMGGRSNWDGTSVEEPAKVTENGGGSNNFQGRYIIRHYWEGALQCQSPIRNRWGGPPSGDKPAPKAAQDLAQAPRGKIDLRKVVSSPVPSLGIPGRKTAHK